ncbi:hypothetical protein [Myxococcus hansupus]|uniref:hypothetical protein n=1 Tax=Pseudomyxococcus hansupus TaxID=1297742 RepID=UPI0011875B08|nr:hypothetical protein [Myxococcus hansupus]
MKLPAFVALLSLVACAPQIRLPKLNASGNSTYEEKQVGEDSSQLIPTPLLRDENFNIQARNCAILYNQARGSYRWCFAGSAALKFGQLASAGLTVLSSGIGPNTPNDVVKRHWSYAGVAGAAALALITGFDFWLNCNDRTFVEQSLAAQRLAHLHNASHLLTCANKAREQRVLTERLREELIGLKSVSEDTDSINDLTAKLKAQPEGSLLTFQAIQSEITSIEKSESLASTTAEYKSKLEQARSTLNKIIDLTPALCEPTPSKIDSTRVTSSPQDYLDRAHAELIKCLQINPVRFNAQAATP